MAKNMQDPVATAIQIMADPKRFVGAIFSGRRRNMQPNVEKVEFRPVKLKNEIKIQMISIGAGKSKTTNLEFGDIQIEKLIYSGFANCLIKSTEQTLTIRFTKKGDPLAHYANQQHAQDTHHDRQKTRLLDTTSEFLRSVGISDQYGRVKPSMNDKYLQIEEFLRILMPTLEAEVAAKRLHQASKDHPLLIVDHGCGNAYLTFAVHNYLNEQLIPNKIVGIDQREDSRKRNVAIAEDLGNSNSVTFRAEKIADSEIGRADIAIALHACDTASDDALAWAIRNQAKIVLVSPCCHHDLQTQMTNIPELWLQVTKHGILKQRLGDILTDSLRAQILRLKGYRTDIIEFIGDDHTSRNLIIRAVLTNSQPESHELVRYNEMVKIWSLTPKLAEMIDL